MEFNLQNDLSQLCRLCTRIIPPDVSIDIFSTPSESGPVNLRDMLSAICSVVVLSDENLYGDDFQMPRRVCSYCRNRIVVAYDVHTQCIETDRKLGEILAIRQELLNGPNDPIRDPSLDIKQELETFRGSVEPPVIKTEVLELNEVEISDKNVQTEEARKKSVRGKRICRVCSQIFKNFRGMEKHIREFHPDEFIYSCDICDQKFISRSGLKTHKVKHRKDLPFKCTECGKGFPRKCAFETHMRRHRGERKYSCDQCSATFFNKKILKKHILSHSKDKPHICDLCGTAFKFLGTLKYHVQTVHAVDRAFKCNTCGLSFTRKEHLQRHIRTHTGEKPYKCSSCDQAFARSYNLVKHSKIHEGENVPKNEDQ